MIILVKYAKLKSHLAERFTVSAQSVRMKLNFLRSQMVQRWKSVNISWNIQVLKQPLKKWYEILFSFFIASSTQCQNEHFDGGVLKTKTPKTPKPPLDPKLENKDPPYFSELWNYDQPVANATESWALATRILRLLLASWTDIIRGIFFVLNWKILCFVSSKELTPGLFEVFNFHRK